MESVENDIVTQDQTTSELSDWIGPPVDFTDVQYVEGIREGDDKVVADELKIYHRIFDLIKLSTASPYLSYGPTSHPMIQIPLDRYLLSDRSIATGMQLYDGLAYDEVEFRISLSNPKGICGGLLVGVYPYQNWYGTSFNTGVGYDDTNLMTQQRLYLSPDSHFMSYSEAKDLVITVPWQRNLPFMNYVYLSQVSLTDADATPMPGCPVIWISSLASTYVSTVTMLARLRIYFKFKNLRCVSPIDTSQTLSSRIANLRMQSGVEVAAFAAGAAVVDAALLAGSEIIKDILTPHQSTFDEGSFKEGSYEAPGAVQMAYAGDTTSIGPPPTTPIFRNAIPRLATRHSILDMIKEPQFLTVVTANNVIGEYLANPTAPLGADNLDGPIQLCSYLRWFSQFAQFWRGTINFHFVIMGHPMVEVGYSMRLTYPDLGMIDPGDNMSANVQMKGIVSGVHHIKVPMPNQNIRDHIQIVDKASTSADDIRSQSASGLFAAFDVVSTMLDVEPTISVAVFYSAGEDFEFLQPNAIGFADVVNASQNLQMQVNLDPPTEVFATRARTQLSCNMMVPMHYVEDFMEIWSRALPYSEYDENDEPIVRLPPASRPVWWPMHGGSASHTLDVNNSWWVTNDYLSLLSAPYLFYRGSIAFKILCDPSSTGYKYVTLSDNNPYRQPTNNPFTYSSTNLPPQANFGYGTVITPAAQQPVLDLTVPYRGAFSWGCTNFYPWENVNMGSATIQAASVITNVVLHNAGSDLKDSLYRKKGIDYAIAVRGLLPPATLWVAKGYDWTDSLSRSRAIALIRPRARNKIPCDGEKSRDTK